MKYIKTEKYNNELINQKIMGPNPLKLEEELMNDNKTKAGSVVMDLGSGQGITSVFLAKEYGFKVYAADLWSEPGENQKFFEQMGLSKEKIVAVKADATDLPFEKEFFDAVVCTDSYNYFGRDEKYLDEKLLPYVKKEGYIYIAIPGMKKDCHDNIPKELLLSWTPEQLDYIHDIAYWKNIISKSKDSEMISISEMESNEECWNDWLKCDNEYAKNDKKSIDALSGKYLNFIANKLISTFLISDFVTPIAKFITNFGGAIFLSIATVMLFLLIKNKKIGLSIISNIVIITVLNQLLKRILQRPRPTEFRIVEETGYSFPSGHSMVSMAFYGYLIYLIYRYIKNKYVKWTLITILSILICLIGISRIYLGVHYTSDVLGGFMISISYLVVYISSIKKLLPEE